MRAYSVSMPEARGAVWIIPASGVASIKRTRLVRHSPLITVRVEHNHVLVVTAPTTAEVVEVAAFAFNATATTAIEDLAEAFGFTAHVQPGLLLEIGRASCR